MYKSGTTLNIARTLYSELVTRYLYTAWYLADMDPVRPCQKSSGIVLVHPVNHVQPLADKQHKQHA